VLDVCDHDKNFGLTLYEVNITLMAIAKSMPLPSPELKDIVRQARSVTPTIFRIVDEDNDEEVTGKELLWVSEMYDLLKEKPVLKGLSNALFTVLDTDADDGLSAEEIRAAIQTDGVVEKLIAIFDERFPIPVLKHGISPEVLLDNLQPAFVAMDVNEDGKIERKESLKAALSFKKQFLGVANLLKNSAMMLKIVVGAYLEKEAAAGTDLHSLAASGGSAVE